MHQLLSEAERARLATIASIVRFEKREEIYHERDRADAVFNIISGIAKACMRGADGTAFWFPEDLFGLAQEGRYVSSVKARSPVTAYRLPLAALRRRLSSDAAVEFHFVA